MPGHFILLAQLVSLWFSSCLACFVEALVEILEKIGTIAENKFIDSDLNGIDETTFLQPDVLSDAALSSFANLEAKFGTTTGTIHFDARSRQVASHTLNKPIILGKAITITLV